jgi:hypothetical protein
VLAASPLMRQSIYGNARPAMWVDMRDLGAMIEHGEPLPHPPGLPRQ